MKFTVPLVVKDVCERATKTFAQAFLAAAPVISASDQFQHAQLHGAISIALTATVFSLLTSWASHRLPVGEPGTASAVKHQPSNLTPLPNRNSMRSRGLRRLRLTPPPSAARRDLAGAS
jgi:hypothetical protein